MSKEDIEKRLRALQEEEALLRRRLGKLEDRAQAAPGLHRPGKVPAEILQIEREIRSVVLGLSDIDRKRQDLTVALAI